MIQTLQAGIPIARSEALCGLTMKAINAHNKTAYKEQPTLFLEFHGTEAGVKEQAELVQEIARAHGGEDFEWATRTEDRNRLWTARHQAYFAGLQLRHGSRAVSTDVCVPISRLTECMLATAADIERASMPIPMFGHVGDGNFHCMILVRPESASDLEEAKAFNDRLVDRALDDGRHLHRRARHRARQDQVARKGARRRRRADGRHQAHLRSGEPAEPRQGRAAVARARAQR